MATRTRTHKPAPTAAVTLQSKFLNTVISFGGSVLGLIGNDMAVLINDGAGWEIDALAKVNVLVKERESMRDGKGRYICFRDIW